ncbi:MAG: hypothetical protein V7749_15305 [Cocleimonas sp.]
MQPTLLKILSIPLISLFLSACGSGSATIILTPERIASYNGSWQSACSYNRNTDLTSIETLYVSDTEYTIYIDEFDNNNCFGSSDYTTEIEGYLYFGDYIPYASNYCDNTIEVDFTAAVIFEDGIQIASSEISAYLNLPSNTSHNIMCTRDGELFTGDLSLYDGRRDSSRPLSMNYNKPLQAF